MADYKARLKGLDERILNHLKEKKSRIPGLAIGIYQGDHQIYFQGIGVANIQTQTPVTPTTVFRLASISKVFTALGIMQLRDQGKLHLDDPVNKYLPKGKVLKRRSDWPEVTFRHLLSHRSGIGELPKKSDLFKAPGFGMNIKWPNPIPPLSTLHDTDITPEVMPGTKYAYCNFGFSLLGYLIEVISGMDYVEYIRKNILDPLEMSHSDFLRSERVRDFEAIGYAVKGKSYKTATYWQGIIKPAGMLYSNVEDMAKFAQMLLNGGVYNERKIIEKATLEECWTPQYSTHERFKNSHAVGLAFQLFSSQGVKIVEHNGATSGFISAFSIIPSQKLIIIVFGNLDEIFRPDETLRVKNLVLWHLLGIEPIAENSYQRPLPKDVSRFIGYYGPYPGPLTNTRVLQSGIDFKLTLNHDHLALKGIFGKPITLYPTEDPLIYAHPLKPGDGVNNFREFAFETGSNGNILHINWAFMRLRKNSFFATFRFKLYLLLSLLIGLICIGIGFSIIK